MYEKHLDLVDTLHYMFRIIKFIVTFPRYSFSWDCCVVSTLYCHYLALSKQHRCIKTGIVSKKQ